MLREIGPLQAGHWVKHATGASACATVVTRIQSAAMFLSRNPEFRCGHVHNALISLGAKSICACHNSHLAGSSGWLAAQLD